MRIFVVSAANSNNEIIETLKKQAEFRKATPNMLMAASAIKQILIPEIENRFLSLIVGSSYGELQTTNDFLSTLTQTGVARPFLFQSSLHNATSGFLTLHYKIQGPSITVSNQYFTAESSLEAATTLLKTKQTKLALVVTVDSYVSDFRESLAEIYPKGVRLRDCGTAMLLANDEGLSLLKKKPLGILERIETFPNSQEKFKTAEYNDSNALELLATDLNSKLVQNELKLIKPDGTHSTIHWKRFR